MISVVSAQGNRPSPADSAVGKLGNANIKIKYSSPSVRGRTIWGDLVPYGKAWRAGANEATTFETDRDIKVNGKTLPAGKYSVFAIPNENEWQIIFNSKIPNWGIKRSGEANYDPADNALVVTAKPKKSSSMNERLKYNINGDGFVLAWENLEVPVRLK